MEDSIKVEYSKFEELFAQKVVKEESKPEEKVSLRIQTSSSEVSDGLLKVFIFLIYLPHLWAYKIVHQSTFFILCSLYI